MRITGSYTVDTPREQLWDALQDPGILARTLPGCSSLEVKGDDVYEATLTAGVASIKGTYRGQVELRDKQRPDSYRLTASGSGSTGTIEADATLRLETDGDTTIVHYEADAVVGGMIGGVGQRMIAGAARRTAGEFFSAVADEVAGRAAPPEAQLPTVQPKDAEVEAPATGQVFEGRVAPASPGQGRGIELLLAAAVGAAIALIGVAVGRRTARRAE